MNEREMLEMAAKAADLPWDQWVEDGDASWNPIADDGDALRLAVKMRMMVDVDEYRVKALAEIAMHEGLEPETVYFDGQSIGVNRGDVNSATRLAITRAAAQIGKSMP